jgi:hypothetical protein
MKIWKPLDRSLRWYERLGAIVLATAYFAGPIASAVLWAKRTDVPAWVPFAVGISVLGASVVVIAILAHRRPHTTPSGPGDAERVRRLDIEIRRSEYGKGLLYDALESVQQALGTDEDWELDQLVQRGILGPVRGLLTRRDHDDVRLAVLMPREDAPDYLWLGRRLYCRNTLPWATT